MKHTAAALVLLLLLHTTTVGAEDAVQATTIDGARLNGQLRGAAPGTLRFHAPSADIPLHELRRIDFPVRAVAWADTRPLRRFRLTTGETLSGTLLHWTPERTLIVARGGQRLEFSSSALSALEMPDGQQEILYTSFDAEPENAAGRQTVIASPPVPWHATAMNLSRSDSSQVYPVEPPCDSGRVSLAFLAPPASVHWGVEFAFDAGANRSPVRLTFQPTQTTYESRFTPPVAATTHPLRRNAGWNHLTVSFVEGRVLISVNDQILATASEMLGPLRQIRLWHDDGDSLAASTPDAPEEDVWIDDLLAVRFTKDEVRSPVVPLAGRDALQRIDGDVLYGRVTRIDPHQTEMETAFGTAVLPSRAVAAIAFAAGPPSGAEVAGVHCRLEFQPLVPWPAAAEDRLLVAVQSVTESEIAADHPFLGRLHIPRDQVRRLRPLFRGRRQLLWASVSHLGNEVRSPFAAPVPIGTHLEGRFTLDAVPRGPVFVRVTVAHLAPAGPAAPPGSPRLSELRRGALLTRLSVNGHAAGSLNSELTYRDTPSGRQSVRLRVPAEWLRPGENRWRIEQQPARDNPREFDDCEIGPMALEIETPAE